ncbi:glycosyltransferase [Mucilaginibacter sp. AK015]|uniref:glycosyltransferase n=1 Tax=Mucilaginibacter sp. AK015 TaxID=2723072 RepID=UPI001611A5DD|nr:glycosyltransferase [Mucilaginibacter sp. AK015]MBB5397100.1 glycosyltransferase involved in cell wall biosynthesis [Mucilaginibacter sp. AK015]
MLSPGDTISVKNTDTPAKISVIIVTYNAAATLQACLDSIYRQRYPNIEIIVTDGGSTDGTVKILEENSDKIASWISEKDKGIYDAMNKSLDRVTGQWVYFIGADDEMFDDFSTMAFQLEDPNAIYYASVLCKGKKFSGFVSDYQIAKYGIYHQAIIYPKIVFDKYRYDTKYVVRADHFLNINCASDKNLKFIFKDYIIANFSHLGVSQNYVDQPFEDDHVGIVFKHFSFKIWCRFMFWRFKKNYLKKPEK